MSMLETARHHDGLSRGESRLDAYFNEVRNSPDPATKFIPLRGKLVWTHGLIFVSCFLMLASIIVGDGIVPLGHNILLGPSVEALLKIGGLRGVNVQAGEWWRLFWSPFLHAGWFHLAMNVVLWYKLGTMIEPDWGFVRTTVVFVFSAFSGSLMSATLDPLSVSVGASGGIFGMMGGCIPYIVEFWHTVPNPKCMIYIQIATLVIGLACGFLPYVDNYAHMGGALGGVLLGFMTITKVDIWSESPQQSRLQSFAKIPRTLRHHDTMTMETQTQSTGSFHSLLDMSSRDAEPHRRVVDTVLAVPNVSSASPLPFRQWQSCDEAVMPPHARYNLQQQKHASLLKHDGDDEDRPFPFGVLKRHTFPEALFFMPCRNADTAEGGGVSHAMSHFHQQRRSSVATQISTAGAFVAVLEDNAVVDGVAVRDGESEQQCVIRLGEHGDEPDAAFCETSKTLRFTSTHSTYRVTDTERHQGALIRWLASCSWMVWRPRERHVAPSRSPTMRMTRMETVEDECLWRDARVWYVRLCAASSLAVYWFILLFFLMVCPKCYTPPGQLIRIH